MEAPGPSGDDVGNTKSHRPPTNLPDWEANRENCSPSVNIPHVLIRPGALRALARCKGARAGGLYYVVKVKNKWAC